jgi:hypothetical protein
MWSDDIMLGKLNAKGFKGTFNLNSSKFTGNAAVTAAKYQEHEVTNHSKYHKNYRALENETGYIPLSEALADVQDGHDGLTSIFGENSIRGFVYPYNRPYGTDKDAPIQALIKDLGMFYARPSSTSGTFDIPTDWYDWKFTCEHTSLNSYKNNFFNLTDDGSLKLFGVWGHSWAFEADVNANPPRTVETWSTIFDPFLDDLDARRDEIFVGTNIEIYDYIQSKNSLVISGDSIYNPGRAGVYVKIDGRKTVIPAGERVYP